MSILIASITGITAAVVVWFTISCFTTNLILSIEKRHPHLAGTRMLRTTEVTICGMVVLASLTFGFWLATVVWVASR